VSPRSALVALTLIGCRGGDDAPPDTDPPDSPVDSDVACATDGSAEAAACALAAAGFTVAPGAFRVADMDGCCVGDRACGNNPSTPYASVFVPPGPGQVPRNPATRPDGTSSTFRLGADEAVVWLGTTPPPARYYGFTPYVADRANGRGGRTWMYASLSETLNHATLPVAAQPFGVPLALVMTADRGTDARVRAALVASGWAADAVATVVVDPTRTRLGLHAAADTVDLLFRVGMFDDPDAGRAWLDALPATVLRASPAASAPLDPLDPPVDRPKDLSRTEDALLPGLDALEAAVRARYDGWDVEAMTVTHRGGPDATACLEQSTPCSVENRDTSYTLFAPRPLFPSTDDVYVLLGVDHHATGKATYANVTVYALEHVIGVAAVTDADWAGSAAAWLPDHPDAPSLFAWTVARRCDGDPRCTAIPDAGCPTGVLGDAQGTFEFRSNLEPGTGTAPDASTMLVERVLRFSRPSAP
jgi:hypothetical protein